MQAFARLLDQLAVKDAMDQSLLDRACVYGTSEYGEGWQHSVSEMACVMAGKCNGALKTGVHVRDPEGNFSKAHVTMLRALGLDTPSFGFSGGQTTEHIPGLLG